MNNTLLLAAAAVVLFVIWRRQQSDAQAVAALGRPPINGGADGSPQSQVAAAHGGSPVVGNSQQSPSLQNTVDAAFGAGVCAALGAGSASGGCAKVAQVVLPVFTEPRHILGRGPPTSNDTKAYVEKQGAADLAKTRASFGTVPLTEFGAYTLRQEQLAGMGGTGWLGGVPRPTTAPPTVTIKDNKVQGDPWLVGADPKPASTGTWVTVASGPAMQSRSGRGHF